MSKINSIKPYNFIMAFNPGIDPETGCVIEAYNENGGVVIQVHADHLEQFKAFMGDIVAGAQRTLNSVRPQAPCPDCGAGLIVEGWHLSCPRCEWYRVIQPPANYDTPEKKAE